MLLLLLLLLLWVMWLLLMMKPLLVSLFVSRSNEEEWNRDWVACGISRHFLEIGHVMRVL